MNNDEREKVNRKNIIHIEAAKIKLINSYGDTIFKGTLFDLLLLRDALTLAPKKKPTLYTPHECHLYTGYGDTIIYKV